MLSVIMLSIVMLIVDMLSVSMLSVVTLSVNMLSVVRLSAVTLRGMTPIVIPLRIVDVASLNGDRVFLKKARFNFDGPSKSALRLRRRRRRLSVRFADRRPDCDIRRLGKCGGRD